MAMYLKGQMGIFLKTQREPTEKKNTYEESVITVDCNVYADFFFKE